MKLSRILHTTVLLLVSGWATAQSFSLSGKVLDEQGNGIELASVTCPQQHAAAIANLKGEYSLKLLSADTVRIRFSMIGYQTKERTLVRPKGRQRLVVRLAPMKALDEVVVSQRRKQTGTMEKVETKTLRSAPSTTGNAVEEIIQQQAGVSSHNELSSQYNVRGGSFDENAVYINGHEIYRPLLMRSGQQEGLSAINPDMVENIRFSSGGFEARYGSKMSSVLDIEYRKPQKTEANIQASLLGASAYLGCGNKTFSMSHGLRYKTNRYLLGMLETKGEYRPDFIDYQTMVNWQPSSRWSFNLTGNWSENHYQFTPEDRETNFGTMLNAKTFRVYFNGQERDAFRTLSATATIGWHPTTKTTVRLQSSVFHSNEKERYDIVGQYWLDDAQATENLGVGTYMEHARNYLTANATQWKAMVNHRVKRHLLEGAFILKREHVKEDAREYEMRDSSGYNIPHLPDRLDLIYSLAARQEVKSTKLEAYLQDEFRFHTGSESAPTLWTLHAGLRWSSWNFNHETTLSPRLALAVTPGHNDRMTLRFATGIYYQTPFYKEMRDTTTVNGSTVVTLNSHIKSQRSIHFTAAFDYRFRMLDRPFRFTAETYYKKLGQGIPYNVQNMKIVYYGENISKGYATGIDLKLFGEFVPGTDSWLTLSLMKTQQEINGVKTPMPTDQRWGMNLHFTDYFPGTERWKMTLRLAFADGLPFGAPHRGIDRQYFRAPSYQRADIGMSYLLYRGTAQTVKHIWLGLDLLNVFGKANVSNYYWVTDVTNHQYAVPNYLTGRQINGKIAIDF